MQNASSNKESDAATTNNQRSNSASNSSASDTSNPNMPQLESRLLQIIEELSHPKAGTNQKQLFDQLTEQFDNNYENYIMTLSKISLNSNVATRMRLLCLIQLKNSFYAADKRKQQHNKSKWLKLSQPIRNNIFTNTFQLLYDKDFAFIAPLCLAYLCLMESQNDTWKQLISQLRNNVINNSDQSEVTSNDKNNDDINLKCSSLTTLGYIAEEMFEYFDDTIAMHILDAVNHGIMGTNSSIKKAAAQTLYNVLDFVHEPSRDKMFRNQILQLIIRINGKENDIQIRILSFACLLKVADIYYEYLSEYIQGLFKVTVEGMSDPEPLIAMHSINFWTTLCQREYEALELHNIQTSLNTCGDKQELKISDKYYCYHALPHMSMILLKTLEADKGENIEGWTPCGAATHFLNTVSKCWGASILEYVGIFFAEQIAKDEWYCKNAAVLAFGSILEGVTCTQLNEAIDRIWPYLVDLLQDQSAEEVRDTSCWVIGLLAERIPGYILRNCSQIVTHLVDLLNSEGKLARTASQSITKIIDAYVKVRVENKNTKNIASRQNLDAFESFFSSSNDFINLFCIFFRNSSKYSTQNNSINDDDSLDVVSITSVATCISSLSSLPSMLPLALYTFHECENHLKGAIACSRLPLITALVLAIQSIVENFGKLDSSISCGAMKIIDKFQNSLTSNNLNVSSDLISLITMVACDLEDDFKPYTPVAINILLNALGEFEYNVEVFRAALGLLSIMCTYLPTAFFASCSDQTLAAIMQHLFLTVSSVSSESFDVKYLILECFGEMILANRDSMFKYVKDVMNIVMPAFCTQIDTTHDIFQYKYAVQLYYSCMTTLSSIIQSYNTHFTSTQCDFLTKNLLIITRQIIRIADVLNSSEDIQLGMTGLIGDLSKFFPNQMLKCFQEIKESELRQINNTFTSDTSLRNPTEGLHLLLHRASLTNNEHLKSVYNYTAEQLKKAKIELTTV